jgi:hypothetical protein
METRSDGCLPVRDGLCRCARGEGLTARHGHMEISKIYHASPNPPRTRRRWKDPPTVTSWLASPSSFEGQQAHAHTSCPGQVSFFLVVVCVLPRQDKQPHHPQPGHAHPARGWEHATLKTKSKQWQMDGTATPTPTHLSGPAQPLRLSLPASHFNVTVHFLHVCPCTSVRPPLSVLRNHIQRTWGGGAGGRGAALIALTLTMAHGSDWEADAAQGGGGSERRGRCALTWQTAVHRQSAQNRHRTRKTSCSLLELIF